MTSYIRRLSRFESPAKIDWLIYFAAFSILHIPGILNFYSNDGANNPYLMFADSLLHGHLNLPPMNSYGDLIIYNNNCYLPYPPFPSIILLPFVAIFGVHHVNTVFIALIMTCINLYLMHSILTRLRVDQKYYTWITLGFFLGTGYWYALFTSHHVYAFAHITSCMLQLLLINEVLGKRRWWLVGCLIGCSFLTRQMTLFYVIFALGYMWYLHKEQKEKIRFSDMAALLAPLGVFVGLGLLYNYLRFGNPMDTGYKYIVFIGVLKDRVSHYGVFSTKKFQINFYEFFINAFNIEFKGDDLMSIKDMDLWGTSLLSASPFVIAAFKAEWPKTLKIFTWLTIITILTGTLLYHNDGYFQVNTVRFALDFLPLLFVLVALGFKHMPAWIYKGLIIYSVLLNLIAFMIHVIYQ